MTIKEIDKILNMINKKELVKLKESLLTEKRQKIFENYLTTNVINSWPSTHPKLYTSDHSQIFTNGVSFYIINNNKFKINTQKLVANKHKFQLVNKEQINTYLNKIMRFYGETDVNYRYYKEGDFIITRYNNPLDNSIMESRFDAEEIDTANILLNNPKKKISHSFGIIKAESEVGIAYILAHAKR